LIATTAVAGGLLIIDSSKNTIATKWEGLPERLEETTALVKTQNKAQPNEYAMLNGKGVHFI